MITVTSTGRDAWMHFEHDDHLELLDDDVELAMRESGTGGQMAKVVSVNDTTGEIEVDQDLSTFVVQPDRNPRIRRWDFLNSAEDLTRPVNNGTAIPLEFGISVTFGSADTDTLYAGDYWVFSARTADGSIDDVTDAPPRGILHHFAKLALVMSGKPPSVVHDCRVFWPPEVHGEGCCSVVVKPGDGIQAAIDSLTGRGGCVCLKMGVHKIDEPLKIRQENLTIHGEVPWVTLEMQGGFPEMLEIVGVANVGVIGIHFIGRPNEMADPLIRLIEVQGGRIAECALETATDQEDPWFENIGIQLDRCSDVVIEDNHFRQLRYGIRASGSSDIRVLDNFLQGLRAISEWPVSLSTMGIHFAGAPADLQAIYVERNVVRDFRRGIQLGDLDPKIATTMTAAVVVPEGGRAVNSGCRVAANLVVRDGGAPTQGEQPVLAFAIAAKVNRCEIVENGILISGLDEGGVIVQGGDVRVERNEIQSVAVFNRDQALLQLPYGVIVFIGWGDPGCTVHGNLLTGLQQGIRVVTPSAQRQFPTEVNVLANRIVGSGALLEAVRGTVDVTLGLTMAVLLAMERYAAIALSGVQRGRVAGNEVSTTVCGAYATTGQRLSLSENQVTESLVGIALVDAGLSEARDNRIEQSIIGVALHGTTACVAARNEVLIATTGVSSYLGTSGEIAFNELTGTGTGIDVMTERDMIVRGNSVQDAQTVGFQSYLALHELTLVDNHFLRCGYRDVGALNPSPAIGISARITYGTLTIDSCHVIDTGETETPTKSPFPGERFGVDILAASSARVHGCVISSRPLAPPEGKKQVDPHQASRALRMIVLSQRVVDYESGKVFVPAGFADATDNVVEQTAWLLVEVKTKADVMFSDNRCTDFFLADGPGVSVVLEADCLAVNNNQVRAFRPGQSLKLVPQSRLTAVGNITTGGASIALGAATEAPLPYNSFNLST